MSRVDEALQAWEKRASGGASSPRSRVSVGEAPNRFGLGGYQREEPASPELPQPPEVTAPVAPAVAEFRRSAVSRAGVGADLEARLVTLASGSVSLEQYRRLAAVLHDVQLQQGLKTLMLTSALPGEGKTLTIVNLALTLSESYGRRVLIIDADLRWPSVHKVLGVENSAGLSEALQGERFDLSIHQVSPRLAVLTAGHPGLTPLAGLTSARMAAVIEECAKQFDWVLLDTPPGLRHCGGCHARRCGGARRCGSGTGLRDRHRPQSHRRTPDSRGGLLLALRRDSRFDLESHRRSRTRRLFAAANATF